MKVVSLEVRFPAGHYHATPWEANVNEGRVEWPPSPWRILRALVAAAHRVGEGESPILTDLVWKLGGVAPTYRLPRASLGQTRHYMPIGLKNRGLTVDTGLVFDTFLVVDPADPMVVQWLGLELQPREEDLLRRILAGWSYLGRRESWVEVAPTDPVAPNCAPDIEEGEAVLLLAPAADLEPDQLLGVLTDNTADMHRRG